LEPEVEPLAVVEALRGRHRRLVQAELSPAHPDAQPQAPDHTQDPGPCHPRYLPHIFIPLASRRLWLRGLPTAARESISARVSQVPDCRPSPLQAVPPRSPCRARPPGATP